MDGVWRHKKTGALYEVYGIANEGADKPGWIKTVVYRDWCGCLWSRPLSKWGNKYEPINRDGSLRDL